MMNLFDYLLNLTIEPDSCLQMESVECSKIGAMF